MEVFSPIYNRKIRVLDFFLQINLKLLFTLIPFYMTDNNELIDLQVRRSIKDKNRTIDSLTVALAKVNLI